MKNLVFHIPIPGVSVENIQIFLHHKDSKPYMLSGCYIEDEQYISRPNSYKSFKIDIPEDIIDPSPLMVLEKGILTVTFNKMYVPTIPQGTDNISHRIISK